MNKLGLEWLLKNGKITEGIKQHYVYVDDWKLEDGRVFELYNCKYCHTTITPSIFTAHYQICSKKPKEDSHE